MASFLEEIKSAKLKKSKHEIKDYSSPKLAGFLSKQEITEYQNACLDVNTELWLDFLKDVTFPSQFCKIKINEAEMFVRIFERLFRNLSASQIAEVDLWSKLEVEEREVIDQLSKRLDVVLKDVISRSSEGFAFVKTSSRSPKDAPMASKKFGEVYKKFLDKLPDGQRKNENDQIVCLLQAAFEAMKVSTTQEVMQLMISSERIYQDFLLALAIKERYHENFVVREFVSIDVDMEFRAFVFNSELTAVSQYNYLIFSPRLQEDKDQIETRLKDFYNDEVKPRLSPEFPRQFIIDFAICKERIWVIEVNPFMVSTDGALFSWEHERHLLEGKQDFEFRIVQKVKPGAKTMLPDSIKTLMLKSNIA